MAKSRIKILDCATLTKLTEAMIHVWYRDSKEKKLPKNTRINANAITGNVEK